MKILAQLLVSTHQKPQFCGFEFLRIPQFNIVFAVFIIDKTTDSAI